MKKIIPITFKMSFFVLLVSFAFNSFGQAKNTLKTTNNQMGKNDGTIIVSANKSCVITINGVQVDLLKENEVKTIKCPVGSILLKGEMTFDNSIFILKEITVNKINTPIIVLDLKKEFESKERERKQKELEENNKTKETNIQSAIANYKNTFYHVDCRSPLLDSQLNFVQRLNYSLVKKCNTCNGKGEVIVQKECSICSGTGTTDCSYCNNGEVSCLNCKGTGKMNCSCAYETISDIILKRYHYNAYCTICGGSAGGKGKLNCNTCSGTGKASCSYCQGSGQKKCGYCKKGYLTSKDCCDECRGIGRVIE